MRDGPSDKSSDVYCHQSMRGMLERTRLRIGWSSRSSLCLGLRQILLRPCAGGYFHEGRAAQTEPWPLGSQPATARCSMMPAVRTMRIVYRVPTPCSNRKSVSVQTGARSNQQEACQDCQGCVGVVAGGDFGNGFSGARRKRAGYAAGRGMAMRSWAHTVGRARVVGKCAIPACLVYLLRMLCLFSFLPSLCAALHCIYLVVEVSAARGWSGQVAWLADTMYLWGKERRDSN